MSKHVDNAETVDGRTTETPDSKLEQKIIERK